jgi:hypothetical protein
LETIGPAETPAEFVYDRPLDPAAWKLWQHPVNRDRLYDFYLKEALFFRSQSHAAHLLPAFPGMDGGKLGHWGNQNEETWKDARWNQTDLGSVLCGVFRAPGVEVPKGVCVRLERANWRVNPRNLNYEAIWKGGFRNLSIRHALTACVNRRSAAATRQRNLILRAPSLSLPRLLPVRQT